MKKWPEDDTKTVYFDSLVKPIIRAIKFGYSMKRKNKNKNIPYSGYNTESEEQATYPNPKEVLSANYLKHALKDQNRTLLEEAITIVFQLGVAQGRRMLRNKMKLSMNLMEKSLEIFAKSKNKERKKTAKEVLEFFKLVQHSFQSLDRFSRNEKL